MNAENTQRLCSRFPDLYRPMHLDRTQPDSPVLPACYIFECGDGWLDLLYRISHALSAHAESAGLDVVATQVKEKFGMLRIYVDGGDEEVDRLLDDGELESATICEVCGAPGTLSNSGRCSTRCESCRRNG